MVLYFQAKPLFELLLPIFTLKASRRRLQSSRSQRQELFAKGTGGATGGTFVMVTLKFPKNFKTVWDAGKIWKEMTGLEFLALL